MRKKIVLLCMFFMLVFRFTTFASNNTIVDLGGEIALKKGQEFEIIAKVNNIERFYAGSITINYDNNIITFNEIKAGDIVTNSGFGKFEVGGTPNSSDNKISYQFTFTGQVAGFNGSGNFARIKGKANKATTLDLRKIALVKLVERTEKNEVQNISFKYLGDNSSDGPIESNNGTNDGNSTGNNSTNNNNSSESDSGDKTDSNNNANNSNESSSEGNGEINNNESKNSEKNDNKEIGKSDSDDKTNLDEVISINGEGESLILQSDDTKMINDNSSDKVIEEAKTYVPFIIVGVILISLGAIFYIRKKRGK